MSVEIWLAFVAASIVLLIIPGPTILTVVSYSMSHGKRANFPLIAAVSLGDSTALVLSLLGLGVLLAKSAFWFVVLKWIGGLYLLYLGIKLLRAGAQPARFAVPAENESSLRLFINTYVVTALNPKGIVFFLAFFPQFVTPGEGATQQLWILALTFVALSTTNAVLYAIFAAKVRAYLASPYMQRIFNISGGTLLSVAGIWALTAKRPA